MKKIVVLMPTRGIMMTETIERLERSCALAGCYPLYIRTKDLPVDQARNELWEKAGYIEWDYLLMLDDDIAVHDETIADMIKQAETTGDGVVVAEYPVHTDSEYSRITGRKSMTVTTWRKWDGVSVQGEDALWSGLGCVLVTPESYVAISDKLDGPFRMKPVEVVENADGTIGVAFDPEELEASNSSGGEDSYFFLCLRKHGIAWSVLPGHIVEHLRIDKFIGWLATSRYVSQHVISRTTSADVPYNNEFKKK